MSEEDMKQDQDAMADEWAAAMEEQGDAEGVQDPDAIMAEAGREAANAPARSSAKASPAAFDELTDDHGGDSEVNLDSILDVPVTVAMEIGRTRMPIRNLLQLNQGSVVELDRLAGEPMDVLVNGTLIAQGEVVVVNEKFGIRLTDVISASDRIKRLA